MKRASADTRVASTAGIIHYALLPLILALLIAATLLLPATAGGQPAAPAVADRHIVVFNEGVAPAAAAADIARQHAATISHIYSSALKGFAGVIPEGRLAALKKDPRVKYVEPDLVMRIAGQVMPTGINRIDADQNSIAKIDGIDERVNVTVAVLDTGIDLDHPDLNVNTALSKTFARFTRNADDAHGHGTHVAGTIGALDNGFGVVGVAPGVSLVSVRVLGSSGSGYLSDIIKGIDYVTGLATTISVANMSLGGTGISDAYREAFQKSVAAGVVYTVAAGNSSVDVYGVDGVFGTSDDYLPAAYPEVATISAMCDADGLPGGSGGETSGGSDDSFAYFTNYSRSVVDGNPVTSPGAAIDLILPGVNIYSTYKGGGYATMSGTSMAAPHAAGLAALYIAGHSKPSNAADVYALRQALIEAAKEQTDPDFGLETQSDPDGNLERLGWAGNGWTSVVDVTAPTVTWYKPDDGATVWGTVKLQISGEDAGTPAGGLTVTWSVTDGTAGTATYNGSHYEADWVTSANGTATLSAIATDAAGNRSLPVTRTVTVDNGTPTVPSMYVSDISWRVSGPHLKAIVTVRVDSGSTDPVLANAKVSFEMTHSSGSREWTDVLTNSNGQAEFQWKNAAPGAYTGAVTSLTYLDYYWDKNQSVPSATYNK